MRPEDIFFRNESMNDDGVRVNRIEFRAAMPSLRLLDAVSLAFSVQCLIPAVLGLLTCLAADKLIFSAPGFEAGPRGPFARTVPFPLWQMISDVHFIAVHGFTAGLTPFARLPLYSLLMGLTGVAISRAAGRQGAMPTPQLPITTVVTPCQGDGVAALSQHIWAS